VVLDEKLVTEIAARAGLADDHPLVSFALTDELQEAALGDAGATERLLRRGRRPTFLLMVLTRAREQQMRWAG